MGTMVNGHRAFQKVFADLDHLHAEVFAHGIPGDMSHFF
jgi:hypothetical protein